MSTAIENPHLASALHKSKTKLLPLIVLMFALAMLDRSNVGFVKTFLETDAGIGAAAYALGAGIFFIGYALFEVPSNLILHKVGARVWLSRIMVSWGIVSIAMMFIRDTTSFYILRFLLGLTEAGFSPGVVLYLTYWFPNRFRSQAYGWYYLGVPIALMLGGPFTGWLLDMTPVMGLKNWQWMFLVQGVLTVAVGVFAFFWLVSRPEQAKWLSVEEKQALADEFAKEAPKGSHGHDGKSVAATFKDATVWRFVAIYFSIQMSVYGVLFYLPSKLAELMGVKVGLQVGLVSAIPWVCTLLLLPVITKLADKNHNWRQMAMAMLGCAVVGIGLATQMHSVVTFVMAITLAIIGFIIVQPLFWNLPTQYLRGRSAAAGTALIGALGNLGGFVAPNMKNWAEQTFQNDYAGLLALSLVGVVGLILLATLRHKATPDAQMTKECLND